MVLGGFLPILTATTSILCILEHCASDMEKCMVNTNCRTIFECIAGCDRAVPECFLNCEVAYP